MVLDVLFCAWWIFGAIGRAPAGSNLWGTILMSTIMLIGVRTILKWLYGLITEPKPALCPSCAAGLGREESQEQASYNVAKSLRRQQSREGDIETL
jgi:hypothetical protein